MHYRKGIVNERLHVDLDRLDAIGRLAGSGVLLPHQRPLHNAAAAGAHTGELAKN